MSAIDVDGNLVHTNYSVRAVTKRTNKKRPRAKIAFMAKIEEDIDHDDDEWLVHSYYMSKEENDKE